MTRRMTPSRAGGTFDWRDLYGQRAERPPKTHDAMRAAVHEMAARGMSEHAIAGATKLSVEQVRRMLGGSHDGP